MNIENIIEAILFVSGNGVDISLLASAFDYKQKEIDSAIDNLKEKYSRESGIHLISYKNKLQLCSNPDYAEKISEVLNPVKEKALTKATLETLSIIAYKQPITRLEIEDIRGVGSDYALDLLEQNNLIEVVGRKDSIGKPLLYGTTEEFLKRFQIENLDKLPSYEEVLEKIKLIEQPAEVKENLYSDFEPTDEQETADDNDDNDEDEEDDNEDNDIEEDDDDEDDD